MDRRAGVRVACLAVLVSAVTAATATTASTASAQSPPAAPDTIAVGDWQLAPTLQIRTRGEYWRDPVDIGGGADPVTGAPVSPGVRNAGGVLERSRLGLGADNGPLKAQLTLEDARVWGALEPSGQLGGSSDFAAFGAYEAYIEAHTASARPSFVRVGRQEVAWGSGRLLGTADWSPTGRSLDAARGHLALGVWDFEVLASILATPQPLGTSFSDYAGPESGGTQLYGALAAWSLDPLLKLEAIGLARVARSSVGVTPSGVVASGPRSFLTSRAEGETYTASLRVHGESTNVFYSAEGAYQLGTAADVAGTDGVDRAAFAAAALAGYTFDRVVLTPTVRLGWSYASGDDGSGKYKQFDPILPDVHVYGGVMDLFAWSNVHEASLRASIVPWTDTTFSLEYRYARLVEASGEWLNEYLVRVGQASGNGQNELGHEIDAVFRWLPWTALELGAAYSLFDAGDGARTIMAHEGRGAYQPNATYLPVGLTHYAYLQATLRVP